MGGWKSRTRTRGLAILFLVTTAATCDSSGIGAFSRAATAQYALLATVGPDGRLTIEDQRDVAGRVGDPSITDPGPLRTVRDLFHYKPEPGRNYQMLLAPAVAAHQDPEVAPGQYALLYLHDPITDLPSGTFPSGGIHGRQSPEEFLDCVRLEAGTETRFDAVVAAVESNETELFYDCT